MPEGLTIGTRQLREACNAWQIGGTMGLSLWLSKHTPRFTVKDYSDLIELVRAELGDDRDYSKEQER